jgi:hypothetical protein
LVITLVELWSNFGYNFGYYFGYNFGYKFGWTLVEIW